VADAAAGASVAVAPSTLPEADAAAPPIALDAAAPPIVLDAAAVVVVEVGVGVGAGV